MRAFTQGCTLEAHAFYEAAADFRRAGARVIGMSAGTIVFDGPPSALDDAMLTSIYGGERWLH